MTNNEKLQQQMIDKQIPPKNQEGIFNILQDTLISYKQRPKEMPLNEWAKNEFLKYPDIYNEEKAKQDADEIVKYTTEFVKSKEELDETIKKGNSIESYLAKKIEKGAELNNISNVAEYANNIDEAISKANENLFDAFITKNGDINQNPQLHGFVAEAHHVNSFNLEAATKDSPYRAEMLQSNGKNSVDIVIKDIEGKIVRKYSAKYGQSAENTESYFKHGDYRGQRKLVPSDQQENISNSTSQIEAPDGTKSSKLSYKEAKQIQEDIQKKKDLNEYNWDKVSKREVTTHITKQTGKNILLQSMGYAVGIIAKRFKQNREKGRILPTWKEVKEDFKEWFDKTTDTTKTIGLKTAVTTGWTIATRKGLIPFLTKNTPAGRLAGMVHTAMENAKTIYKLAKGEISLKEAYKQMSVNSASTIGGLIGAGEGATIGASIGAIFGPIGSVVGGFIGGAVGAIAGSEIGKAVAKGFHKVVDYSTKAIKTAYESVKSVAKSVGTAVGNGIKAVGNAVSKVGSFLKSIFS